MVMNTVLEDMSANGAIALPEHSIENIVDTYAKDFNTNRAIKHNRIKDNPYRLHYLDAKNTLNRGIGGTTIYSTYSKLDNIPLVVKFKSQVKNIKDAQGDIDVFDLERVLGSETLRFNKYFVDGLSVEDIELLEAKLGKKPLGGIVFIV